MSITETDATLHVMIGETAAALLPADEAWNVQPGFEHPEGPTTAAGAEIGGRMVAVIVSAAMSRRIQVGPPPVEGLLDGMEPAIAAVAQLLELGEVGEIITMNPAELSEVVASGGHGACLRDGEEHLATIIVTPERTQVSEPEMPAAEFAPISESGGGFKGQSGLEVLHDVQMGVTVELGRTRMSLKDILTVVPGSVIELDRAASAPVDVLVNGTLIARGEVVVIDEEFGLRVTEVLGHDQTAQDEALRP